MQDGASAAGRNGSGCGIIVVDGRLCPLDMTWRYLEFLCEKMPRQFACVKEALQSSARDINALDKVLVTIETVSNVPRAAIFQQVLDTCAKQAAAQRAQHAPAVAGPPQDRGRPETVSAADITLQQQLQRQIMQQQQNHLRTQHQSQQHHQLQQKQQQQPALLHQQLKNGRSPPPGYAGQSSSGAVTAPPQTDMGCVGPPSSQLGPFPASGPSAKREPEAPHAYAAYTENPRLTSHESDGAGKPMDPNYNNHPGRPFHRPVHPAGLQPPAPPASGTPVPRTMVQPHPGGQYYSAGHHPQGAGRPPPPPTSPSIQHIRGTVVQQDAGDPGPRPHYPPPQQQQQQQQPPPPQYTQLPSSGVPAAGPPAGTGMRLGAPPYGAPSATDPRLHPSRGALPQPMDPAQVQQYLLLQQQQRQQQMLLRHQQQQQQQAAMAPPPPAGLAPLPPRPEQQQQPTEHLPPGRAESGQHVIVYMMVQRLRHIAASHHLNVRFSNEPRCAEVLLNFFSHWLTRLWTASVETSFKRVDCPPTPLDPFVVSSADHQAGVEKLKALRTTDAVRFSQFEETAKAAAAAATVATRFPVSAAVGGARRRGDRRGGKGARDEDEGSTTPRSPRGDEPLTTSSAGGVGASEALKELGLEDSLFGSVAPEPPGVLGAEKRAKPEAPPPSLTALRRAMVAEAERRAQEANAVRRRQGKLTREVAVEDIITAIRTRPDEFPMPRTLRIEVLRFFSTLLDSYSPEGAGGVGVSTLLQSDLLGWKSLVSNRCVPRPRALGPGPVCPPVGDATTPAARGGLKRRFVDVWAERATSPLGALRTSHHRRPDASSESEHVRSRRKRFMPSMSGSSTPVSGTPTRGDSSFIPSQELLYAAPARPPFFPAHPGAPTPAFVERPPTMGGAPSQPGPAPSGLHGAGMFPPQSYLLATAGPPPPPSSSSSPFGAVRPSAPASPLPGYLPTDASSSSAYVVQQTHAGRLPSSSSESFSSRLPFNAPPPHTYPPPPSATLHTVLPTGHVPQAQPPSSVNQQRAPQQPT